jgi:hypothetical protein
VSEDGRTILFLSSEALDPEHSDGGINVYVWRHGVQTAITATNSVLPVGDNAVLSLSGESIAFTSSSRLLPQDGDAVRDVYVARADGGSPIVPPPALCAGEACQGAPGTPPATPGTATESFQGAGNVVPKHAKKQKKKKKSKHRKRHRTNSKHAANGTQGGRK